MKSLFLILFVFFFLFFSGCVELEPTNTMSCSVDSDCSEGFSCINEVCVAEMGVGRGAIVTPSVQTITKTYSFEAPVVSSVEFTTEVDSNVLVFDGSSSMTQVFDLIEFPGLQLRGVEGEPVIPFQTVRLLIPFDSKIKTVKVIGSQKTVLSGKYNLQPGQKGYPILPDINFEFVEPNPIIYEVDEFFPVEDSSKQQSQFQRGYEVMLSNVYPLHYNPVTGEVYYYKSITVEVETQKLSFNEMQDNENKLMFRGLQKDEDLIKTKIDNLETLDSYGFENTIKSLPGRPGGIKPFQPGLPPPIAYGEVFGVVDEAEYLVITSKALKNSQGDYTFQDLMQKREEQGLSTAIITVEEINDHVSGVDLQERIRNFIRIAYINWETEYVLLGGDGDGADVGGESGDNIIPARLVFAIDDGSHNEKDIAADIYYSCLDGSYDWDEDGVYGEVSDGENGSDVDLSCEVFVGRAPVDSEIELSNFVRKTLAYEQAKENGDEYLKKILMVGEHLGFSGDMEFSRNALEEVRLGTTKYEPSNSGFPFSYYQDTLYDKDNLCCHTWCASDTKCETLNDNSYCNNHACKPDNCWLKSELLSKMSESVHIINHGGHSSNFSNMRLKNNCENYFDVDNLTNSEYFIAYSTGCYPAAFDNWKGGESGGYRGCDSIAEHFLTSSGGSFAYVGNSRWGWSSLDHTNGPAESFNKQFWDAVYGEGILNIGNAVQDSRSDLVGMVVGQETPWRNQFFELTVLGDSFTELYVPSQPEHEIAIKEIITPKESFVDEQTSVSVKVINAGSFDEENVEVKFYQSNKVSEDPLLVHIETIPIIKAGEETTVSYSYDPQHFDEYINDYGGCLGYFPFAEFVTKVEISSQNDEYIENNTAQTRIELLPPRIKLKFVGRPREGSFENGYFVVVINEEGEIVKPPNFVETTLYEGDDYYEHTLFTDLEKFDLIAGIKEMDYPNVNDYQSTLFFKRIDLTENPEREIVLDVSNATLIQTNFNEIMEGLEEGLVPIDTLIAINRTNDYAPPWLTTRFAPIWPWRDYSSRVNSGIAIESDNDLLFSDYKVSLAVLAADDPKTAFLGIGTDFYYPFNDLTSNISLEEINETTVEMNYPFIYSPENNNVLTVASYSPNYALFRTFPCSDSELSSLEYSGIYGVYSEKNYYNPSFSFYHFDDCEYCNYLIAARYTGENSIHHHIDRKEYWNGVGTAPYNGDEVMPETITFYKEPLSLALSNEFAFNYAYRDLFDRIFPKIGELLIVDFTDHKLLRGYLKDAFDSGSEFLNSKYAGELFITTSNGDRVRVFTEESEGLPDYGFGAWLIDCSNQSYSYPDILNDSKFCETGDYLVEWTIDDLIEGRTLTLNKTVSYDGEQFIVLEG
ncbi:MAG: C25 family cysteine peptidase [archaeon]